MKHTVLIVEDDEQLATAVRARLEAVGYRVFHVSTAPAGVGAAEKYRPSAIVLDIGLSRGDGFEVCRDVRKLPGLEHVGILFLSANSDSASRQKASRLGGDMFLAKPCRAADLVEAVGELVDRSTVRIPCGSEHRGSVSAGSVDTTRSDRSDA